MTAREFYEGIGEDYEEVLRRMLKEDRITKYILKFADVRDFDRLRAAFDADDAAGIFFVAHVIRGICLDLGFQRLGRMSGELCDSVREGKLPSELSADLAAVEREAARLKAHIGAFAA